MLPVTYEYLSDAFGLRRAGGAETLVRFEEHGLIRKMRGALQIDDRKSLEQKTCCCYKLISSAYASSVHCLGTSGSFGQPPREARWDDLGAKCSVYCRGSCARFRDV
ncbi:hypothetical protein [Bradyrhizobium sp. CCBAU 51753]|uniref:hypothetical protein n=1 Tax=Bradyrhizobium sp. CCBAU 51753 TaxID=1325100 RepID=UPI001FEDC58D|nr:hypothetical protein [Bradyrhizobium sp. CCBAU 51753]